MIGTKKALPRRTFLRGAGTVLALPLLDAMIPSFTALAKTAAAPIRRLGFVYIPNGSVMSDWTPRGVGETFEWSPILSPLAPFRQKILILSNLAQKQANSLGDGAGDHSRATVAWLSGVHCKRTEGSDVRAATTADQIAAQQLGAETQLSSLELSLDSNEIMGTCDVGYSCTYLNNLSWRSPSTPAPAESNPRAVFERLFGEGASASARLAQLKDDRSILDSVTGEIASLRKGLGSGDRAKVEQYLDSIRTVEQRIQNTEARSASLDMALPERPLGVPSSYAEHAKLMFDLQALAFKADITRVVTLQMGREVSGRTFPELGVSAPHHSLSHHRNDPEKIAKLTIVNKFEVELFAHLLEQLRNVQDGDGSLLDQSLILFGGAIGDGNTHSHSPLPLLIAGGGGSIKGGRHVEYPEDTPMTNVLLTMLDKVGARTESLGDSTTRLTL